MLSDLGEYVQSPASKLEEPVIRRLYEALGAQHESAKPKSPPEWQWKSQSDQVPANAKPARNDRGEVHTSWHSRERGDWWVCAAPHQDGVLSFLDMKLQSNQVGDLPQNRIRGRGEARAIRRNIRAGELLSSGVGVSTVAKGGGGRWRAG